MTFIFSDSFIGYAMEERNVLFSGTDSESNFLKRLKENPIDWYYTNTIIQYQRNEFGHRSKSLKDLNLDNYLLFLGCSHTEGIGLEIEKTYPVITANALEIDHYNLALGGTGIDTIYHNLFVWLNKVPIKPKCIIVQIPELSRFILTDNRNKIYMQSIHTSEENTKEYIIMGEIVKYWESRYFMLMNAIKSLGTPFIEVCMFQATNKNQIVFENLDYARDKHLGIKSQQLLSEKLTSKIKSLI